MSVIIYHNPRCSKSRETLALLKAKNIEPEIILYLEKSFNLAELQDLVDKLNIQSVRTMMRNKDELYRSLKLDNPALSNGELLQAIVEYPSLLERPIVVNGNKAQIGRPPEAILSIL